MPVSIHNLDFWYYIGSTGNLPNFLANWVGLTAALYMLIVEVIV
jgi:hypothetical protein